MAEVYGTKPKKFTKEWWPYFWMYYKWHTIAIVFVVLAVAFTAFQCATKEKHDLIVTYAATANIPSDSVEKFEEALSKVVEDADGDGKQNVGITQLNFSNAPGQEEVDSAMQQKLDAAMMDDNTFLYIFDVDELSLIAQREHTDETYMDVREWLDDDIKKELEAEGAFDDVTEVDTCKVENNKFFCRKGDMYSGRQYSTNADEKGQYFYPISEPDNKIYGRKVIYSKSGTPIAVCLENSAVMTECNIDASELYACVRMDYTEKDMQKASQRCAEVAANALLKK